MIKDIKKSVLEARVKRIERKLGKKFEDLDMAPERAMWKYIRPTLAMLSKKTVMNQAIKCDDITDDEYDYAEVLADAIDALQRLADLTNV